MHFVTLSMTTVVEFLDSSALDTKTVSLDGEYEAIHWGLISPDKRWIGFLSPCDVVMWDSQLGAMAWKHTAERSHRPPPIAFSHSGCQVVINLRGRVQIRDTLTGTLVSQWAFSISLKSVTFSSDDNYVLCDDGQEVTTWDIESGTKIEALQVSDMQEMLGVSIASLVLSLFLCFSQVTAIWCSPWKHTVFPVGLSPFTTPWIL
jgi:WD40 repeat protein